MEAPKKVVVNHQEYYSLIDLYERFGWSLTQYSRWVKSNLLEIFVENEDFLLDTMSNEKSGKRGRFRQEYLLTENCAEHLALMSKTEGGKQFRQYLLDQKKKVEEGKLLDYREAFVAMELLTCLSVKENRKEIEKMHFEKYKSNGGSVYNWHNYRNQLLGASIPSLKQQCKDLGIICKDTDTREILWCRIDHFGLIRETAAEFAIVGGSTDPKRFANIVYEFAKLKNLPFVDTNDPNLFYQPIPVLVAASLLKGGSE